MDKEHIKRIVSKIPTLTSGQLFWINKVINSFNGPHEFLTKESDLFDKTTLNNFGDALRIHHSFSQEPFSKDKFEYVLEQVLILSGQNAKLAPKGNRGHDISINGSPVSLKTQADKGIKKDRLWISKFMELGRGVWGDNPKDLEGLRDEFLLHMRSYERILSLRAINKAPDWHYELVEIPKHLLELAASGKLEMKRNSKQYPKPGYCHVSDKTGNLIFQLYFDGGSERKLQIKNLMKINCIVHATWKFRTED